NEWSTGRTPGWCPCEDDIGGFLRRRIPRRYLSFRYDVILSPMKALHGGVSLSWTMSQMAAYHQEIPAGPTFFAKAAQLDETFFDTSSIKVARINRQEYSTNVIAGS
ncbi:MAG: hypothetical protein NT022_11430, partial [Deltaproteobacteria bacterium]|nr:hypothetical protein [Deltaproteobacteria bacterium]